MHSTHRYFCVGALEHTALTLSAPVGSIVMIPSTPLTIDARLHCPGLTLSLTVMSWLLIIYGAAIITQAQKRPKVFGCAQIISMLNTEQNYLTRLPTALPMRDVGRANVTDPMRYLVGTRWCSQNFPDLLCCVSHLQVLSTTRLP
jgi:hypothetical protein